MGRKAQVGLHQGKAEPQMNKVPLCGHFGGPGTLI
jgi:hypothetical protein